MTDLLPAVAVPPVPSDAEINGLYRMSKALAMSGMFKDVRQAEQAFAKVLIGRDLGLSPTQAMMGIHLIEGKPELSANLQAAFVKRTPGYDFRVIEHTDEVCEIAYFRDGEQLGTSRFSMDDARRAGLGSRGPWKSYPRNMLYARAMSNGVAFHCPEVTGGVKTYVDGELGGEEKPPEIDNTFHADGEFVPDGVTALAGLTDDDNPIPSSADFAAIAPPEAEVVEPTAVAEPPADLTPEQEEELERQSRLLDEQPPPDVDRDATVDTARQAVAEARKAAPKRAAT